MSTHLPRSTPIAETTAAARWFPAAVILLVVLRAVFVAAIFAAYGDLNRPDSPLYLTLAQNLAELGWFSASSETFVPEVFRTPGYPAFLAVFQQAGLDAAYWPIGAQHLLYLASVAIFFFSIRRLIDAPIARAGALFLLIEPGGLAYPSFFLSDAPALLLLMASIMSLGFYLRHRRLPLLLACAVLLGLATLVRPAAMYLPIIFAFVIGFVRRPTPRSLLHGAMLILAFAVVISPWLIRNHTHFGVPYVTAQASNMFGNYHVPIVWESARGIPFVNGQRTFAATVDAERARHEQQLGRALDLVEINRLRQALALEELGRYPADYAFQWGIGVLKTLLGINVTEIYASFRLRSDRLHYFEIDETAVVKKLWIFLSHQDPLVAAELLLRLILTAFAALGAIAILRSRDPFLIAILLTTAYFVFIPGPMGLARLRFPVEGLLFIQAWLGLRLILEPAVEPQRKQEGPRGKGQGRSRR